MAVWKKYSMDKAAGIILPKLADYSEKSLALFFSTKPAKSQISSLKKLGCRYNPNLTWEGKKTPGWVISKKHSGKVDSLVESWKTGSTKLAKSPKLPKPPLKRKDGSSLPQSGPSRDAGESQCKNNTIATPHHDSDGESEKEKGAEPKISGEETMNLARKLMDENNLAQWHLKVSNSKRTIALCQSKKSTIKISGKWLGHLSEKQAKEAILHEIAHAHTPGHHHDSVWKAKAMQLGASGERCARFGGNHIEYAFTVRCPCGANNFGRDRIVGNWSEKKCKICFSSLTVHES